MVRFADESGLLDPYVYEGDGLEADYPTPSPWWTWYRDVMLTAYGLKPPLPKPEPARPEEIEDE